MNSKRRSKDKPGRAKKMKKLASSGSDSSDEASDVDEVQIDFSGFELAPCDFTGIRLLLNQVFLKTHVDLSEMSSFLIDQLDVGIVIKESEISDTPQCEDDMNEDDTVYGLISVISLTPAPEQNFVQQLRNFFMEMSKQHAIERTRDFIHSLLNDSTKSVGYIINERYLNLPPALSVPSFPKLKNEIQAMSKKDAKFNFTHYIIICKLYKMPVSKKQKATNQNDEIIWCNAEEKVFDKEADARFEFSVTKESDSGISGSWTEDDVEMLPFRRVLVFSAHKFDEIIDKISTFNQ